MTALVPVETSGTLTNTTVAITANTQQVGLIISNPSDTVMTYSPTTTASATVGIAIPAGTAIVLFNEYCPATAGTLFCAGTSKAYTIVRFLR